MLRIRDADGGIMGTDRRALAPQTFSNRREYGRAITALAGKLFLPAESSTTDCSVTNLSASGAGLKCDDAPPLDSFVILYIDGFGRYEAVTTRYVDSVLGVRFVCRDAKRKRLIQMLEVYLSEGVQAVTRFRRHTRIPSASVGYLIRADGEHAACDVLDISLQGISLRTQVRPPIGELVNLGKTYGRVVRHHPEGIGVEYLTVVESNAERDQANGWR